jgi:hypothetical protein
MSAFGADEECAVFVRIDTSALGAGWKGLFHV